MKLRLEDEEGFKPFTRDFIGREWLFDKLDKIQRGIIFLLGQPGTGKTAIAAKIALTKMVPTILIERLHSIKTGQIIRELADQISHYWGIKVNPELRRIIEAIKEINRQTEEVPTIVIDGLDEAEKPEEIISLIDEICKPYIKSKVIVTARTGIIDSQIRDLRGKISMRGIPTYTFELKYSDKKQLKDVQKYVQKMLEKPELEEKIQKQGYKIEEAIEILVKHSNGNFVVASSYIKSIEESKFTIKDVEKIPITRTLEDWYTHIINLIAEKKTEVKKEDIIEVLSIISAIPEPTTIPLLKIITEKDEKYLKKIVKRVSLLLIKVGGRSGYIIMHKTLQEYLEKIEEVNFKEIHRKIAEKIFGGFEKAPKTIIDWDTQEKLADYAVRNLVHHFYEANMINELFQFVDAHICPVIEEQNIEVAYRNINLAIKAINKVESIEEKIERLLKYAKTKTTIINPDKLPDHIYETAAKLAQKNEKIEKQLITYIKSIKNKINQAKTIAKTAKHLTEKTLKQIQKILKNIPQTAEKA